MADTVTNNRNLTQPQVGGDSGTWGTILNNALIAYLDNILGATQAVTINSSDVTLTVDQWNNAAFNLTGTLTGNRSLILPLNANSLTVAVGGYFIVNNQTTGAFQVTVKTAASGSTGTTVPQGTTAILYSDTTNVVNADSSKLQIIPYAGNPTGNVAGTAASLNNPPSVVWDYTNNVLYICTTTGTSSTAAWTDIVASGAPAPTLEGYLTPVSNTPVIASDSIAATAVYYTQFTGSWAAIHNGTNIIPYRFAQMQLTLTSSQAANNIYDMYLCYNGGTPVVGTGPSWLSGTGGSVTPGSCIRGTGTGGAAITRDALSGLLVNAASMSVIYNTGSGNNTITVAAGQGIFLGSIFIDAIAGQLTCHRGAGQNRKWGISNAYNRQPVNLIVADPTASWSYTTGALRASNGAPASYSATAFNAGSGTACNGAVVFSCLAEVEYDGSFSQSINIDSANSVNPTKIGIGVNSTTATAGLVGSFANPNGGRTVQYVELGASNVVAPSLGINNICCLEYGGAAYNTCAFQGTGTNMQMIVSFSA